jgi:hypothetical protein
MKLKQNLLMVAMLASLTACGSMTTLQTENTSEKQVPNWYLDHQDKGSEMSAWYKPWDREGMYYAVAEDVSPSMEMALKKATLKAKAKIADRVAGEMNNKTTIDYNEKGNPDRPVGKMTGQDLIVNVIADTVLRTYGIDRKLITYNKEQNNYRAFVMIKISQKDVQTLAANYDQKKAQ